MTKNEEVKISIITPAYNASKYIGATIDSVIAQTYQNWELIIVNDCSKDNTVEVVQKYANYEPRIRLIDHETNVGVACARNTALDAATGDYIAFLDSDDMWMPEKLEKQLNFMQENNFAITYTKYQIYFSDTCQKGKVVKAKKKMTERSVYKDTSIACLTVMVNRKETGLFHMPRIKHTEDNVTWQEIMSRGYAAYGLLENLALYRMSSSSMTGNKMKAARDQWDTYRKYYKFSLVKSAYFFCWYAFNAIKRKLF